MNLGELIGFLEKENPEKRLVMGLGEPDSYRGYYEQLAFPLQPSVTVAEMLAWARGANGKTYQGYKGGSFEMHSETECHVAQYGDTGSELSPGLLFNLIKYEVK